MDDSTMARIITIGVIFRKLVFKRTASKNRKSGAVIDPTVSIEELDSVASTKSEVEGLERAGGIEDDSISGSG